MNNKGFSFLELMVAVVIFLVIASWVTTNYRRTVEHKRLQTEADKLYSELHGIRMIGFKEGAERVIVRFVSSQRCSIYVDTGTVQKPAPLMPYREINIPDPVVIGIPEIDGPFGGPVGVDFNESGVTTGWQSTGLVMVTRSVGETNTGAIYLSNSRLDKFTYCICVLSDKIVFSLYKWDGEEWTKTN